VNASGAFVEAQRAYWRDADGDRFRWQTGGGYIAETEAALLDAVDVRAGERLLEIGCGEGANLHHLAERQPRARYVGIDFSTEKARFAASATPAIAARADAARLPFADASFDAVLVRDLLHHVPARAAVLAEAARVLRRGGRLTVIEPNGRSPLIAAMAAAIPEERGMLASTATRLLGEVAAAGLVEVRLARRQALPLSRVVLHHRLGAPSLGRSARVQTALRRLERAAERLPGWLWAYLVVTGRRS